MGNKVDTIHWKEVFLVIISIFVWIGLFFFNLWLLYALSDVGLNIIGVYGVTGFVFVFEILFFKMIYQVIKQIQNNQKPFDFLRKRKPFDETQMLIVALQNLPHDLSIQKMKDGVDIATKKGNISIRFLKGKGLLQGKLSDKEWLLNGIKVINPFPSNNMCYLIRESEILYQLEDIFVGSISQIIFKIENLILNQ